MTRCAALVLRFGWVGLFLWFGVQQLMHPGDWVGFLPEWTGYLPIPGEMLVQLNGWLEVCLAVLLAVGAWTRAVAGILAVHLAAVAVSAGGAVGVRDAGLATIGLAIALSPPDAWTLDAKRAAANMGKKEAAGQETP